MTPVTRAVFSFAVASKQSNRSGIRTSVKPAPANAATSSASSRHRRFNPSRGQCPCGRPPATRRRARCPRFLRGPLASKCAGFPRSAASSRDEIQAPFEIRRRTLGVQGQRGRRSLANVDVVSPHAAAPAAPVPASPRSCRPHGPAAVADMKCREQEFVWRRIRCRRLAPARSGALRVDSQRRRTTRGRFHNFESSAAS